MNRNLEQLINNSFRLSELAIMAIAWPNGNGNNIKFEYSISRGKKEIMRTLRNMIDFLKSKTDKVVEDIKRMPKVNPGGVNEGQ